MSYRAYFICNFLNERGDFLLEIIIKLAQRPHLVLMVTLHFLGLFQ